METPRGSSRDLIVRGRLASNVMSAFVFDPKYTIPPAIVDDVICRFLLNIPKEEKFDSIRVCFQIELAHWFFQDYYCRETSQFYSPSVQHLLAIPYDQFAYIMFQNTPYLRPRLADVEMFIKNFREYKIRVPTYGAILMNQSLTKVVLVQGFRNNWGFPKGKVNQDEHPVACAIREVFEETGYDISEQIKEDNFIESRAFDRYDRLYIIRGVDLDYPFRARPYEIKSIKWFNIEELPEHKKDDNPLIANSGVPIRSFFTVYPYIKRLRAWISDKLEGRYRLKNFRARQDRVTIKNQTKFKDISKSQNLFLLKPQLLPETGLKDGPVAQEDTEVCEYCNPLAVTLCNCIQELLLDLDELPAANHQHHAVTLSRNYDDITANIARKICSVESKSTQKEDLKVFSPMTTTTNGSSSLKINQAKKLKNTKKSTVRDELLTAPSWANFTFNRESIYRAFSTPSV